LEGPNAGFRRARAARVTNSAIEKRLVELYSAHAGATIRLAYLLTGDRDAAEDICQEAFARIGGKLGALRNPDHVRGYLFRMVLNLSRGHGRKLARERRVREKLPVAPYALLPDLGTHDELSSGLLRLPLRQRTAVFLRFYQDLSESETAEVLNCSVAAVRSLTFRAMESLRNYLHETDQ
jgi:RNA polymerase sigma factor (sigma-70 family)